MPGLMRMAARTAVVAGTATAVSNRVNDRHYANQQQAYNEQQQQAPQAAPATAQDSVTDQLQQLAAMHNSGVLSDAEFEAGKAKILG